MKDNVYRWFCRVLNVFLWRGEILGKENLPRQGPAIFLGNHSGFLGPVASVCSAGVRLYPWVIADMLDPHRCAAYMQSDFIEKVLKLKPPLSAQAARVLAWAVVPLLNGVGCIPVCSGADYRKMGVMLQVSLERLANGKCLLVFPEKPNWEADPITGIHHFSKGVLWLIELYYIKCGLPLRVIPFTVHPSRKIRFLPPLDLTPKKLSDAGGKESWIRSLEGEVRANYRQMENSGGYLAHRNG